MMTDKEKQDLFWEWFQTQDLTTIYDVKNRLLKLENFKMNGWVLEFYTDYIYKRTSHDVREIEMWKLFEPTLRQKEREEKLKSLGL